MACKRACPVGRAAIGRTTTKTQIVCRDNEEKQFNMRLFLKELEAYLSVRIGGIITKRKIVNFNTTDDLFLTRMNITYLLEDEKNYITVKFIPFDETKQVEQYYTERVFTDIIPLVRNANNGVIHSVNGIVFIAMHYNGSTLLDIGKRSSPEEFAKVHRNALKQIFRFIDVVHDRNRCVAPLNIIDIKEGLVLSVVVLTNDNLFKVLDINTSTSYDASDMADVQLKELETLYALRKAYDIWGDNEYATKIAYLNKMAERKRGEKVIENIKTNALFDRLMTAPADEETSDEDTNDDKSKSDADSTLDDTQHQQPPITQRGDKDDTDDNSSVYTVSSEQAGDVTDVPPILPKPEDERDSISIRDLASLDNDDKEETVVTHAQEDVIPDTKTSSEGRKAAEPTGDAMETPHEEADQTAPAVEHVEEPIIHDTDDDEDVNENRDEDETAMRVESEDGNREGEEDVGGDIVQTGTEEEEPATTVDDVGEVEEEEDVGDIVQTVPEEEEPATTVDDVGDIEEGEDVGDIVQTGPEEEEPATTVDDVRDIKVEERVHTEIEEEALATTVEDVGGTVQTGTEEEELVPTETEEEELIPTETEEEEPATTVEDKDEEEKYAENHDMEEDLVNEQKSVEPEMNVSINGDQGLAIEIGLTVDSDSKELELTDPSIPGDAFAVSTDESGSGNDNDQYHITSGNASEAQELLEDDKFTALDVGGNNTEEERVIPHKVSIDAVDVSNKILPNRGKMRLYKGEKPVVLPSNETLGRFMKYRVPNREEFCTVRFYPTLLSEAESLYHSKAFLSTNRMGILRGKRHMNGDLYLQEIKASNTQVNLKKVRDNEMVYTTHCLNHRFPYSNPLTAEEMKMLLKATYKKAITVFSKEKRIDNGYEIYVFGAYVIFLSVHSFPTSDAKSEHVAKLWEDCVRSLQKKAVSTKELNDFYLRLFLSTGIYVHFTELTIIEEPIMCLLPR